MNHSSVLKFSASPLWKLLGETDSALEAEKDVKRGRALPPPLLICICLNFALPILVPHADTNPNDRKSLFCPFQKEFWSSDLRLTNTLWRNLCWNAFSLPNPLPSGPYLFQISKLLNLCGFISPNIPGVLECNLKNCWHFYFAKGNLKSDGARFHLQFIWDF